MTTGRPSTPPPDPTGWYDGNTTAPVEPDNEQRTCPNCGRTFWTSTEVCYPYVQPPRFCSRTCKTQYHNRLYYRRHKQPA